ncbi:MAG: hypothetical protein QM529_07745 [Hydrotalea sp.]|nr:hypothetical protein [Hydrotalea sp.]
MKNNLLNTSVLLLTTILTGATHANLANAQTAKSSNSGTGANGPLLANAVAGKLLLKADVGYVYSFAGDWSKTGGSNPGDNKSTATGGVGYGVSLGWTSKTGFGLSADYLGFNHKWTGLGTNDSTTQFNYDAPYHVMTITPSYRFKLDSADNWGLRVGLGVGFSLSDVNWARQVDPTGNAKANGTKVAGGAAYYVNDENVTPSDFGLENDLTGDCATSGGKFNINILFTDSNYGAESKICKLLVGDAKVEGFTDDQIVTAINNGKIKVAGAVSSSLGIAYSVWSKALGANATPAGVTALISNAITVIHFQLGTAVVMNADTWGKLTATQQNALVTAGVVYENNTAPTPTPTPAAASSGGSAKDDAGFVLAPQVALEYDNNLLHFDINVKYIHGLLDVRYFGSEGAVSGSASSGAITYTSKAGPLALFIGAGLGINF